jgi:hypothetical protein
VAIQGEIGLHRVAPNIPQAAYDPVKGEIVFTGEGEIPFNEQIDMDDLVVAIRSIYEMKDNPGVTFATKDEGLTNGVLDVTYFGAGKGTQFGQILFEADYLLRQLTLGINPCSDTPPSECLINYGTVLPTGLNSFKYLRRARKKRELRVLSSGRKAMPMA